MEINKEQVSELADAFEALMHPLKTFRVARVGTTVLALSGAAEFVNFVSFTIGERDVSDFTSASEILLAGVAIGV